MSLILKVESYSGYKADERPVRFTPATRDSPTYQVEEIVDRWYGIGFQCFKVRADDGNIYILRHNETDDFWTLDSFRSEFKPNDEIVKSRKSTIEGST